MNERKGFMWYKEYTQILIENEIYRKRSVHGQYCYFQCKEKKCPASCKIHIPLEDAKYADIMNHHEHLNSDKVLETSNSDLNIKTQAEPIIKNLISQNPNLNIEEIETLFNQQFPETYIL